MQQQTPYRTKTEFSCWKNGELVSADRASVSVHDHGLLYGDGCFEGLRFYHGRPFMLDRHLARLRRSLQALAITIPYTDDTLTEAVMTCIRGSGMHDGYLRILVTRGEGDMGLDPRNCTRPNVFIIPAALSLVSDTARRQGICLITSSIRRATGTGLDARVKSLNYLHSVLARMHNQIKQWCQGGFLASLVDQLLEYGYEVWLTADHGNIQCDGKGRPSEGVIAETRGERVRVYPTPELRAQVAGAFPFAHEWQPVGLPADYFPLVATGHGAFVNPGDAIVGHGGIAIEEVIVPLVKFERRSSNGQ